MCKKTKEQKFIMLPSVDFCFQELMEDEEVRRGFIGAFLRIPPEEILDMELLPKKLRKKYKEEKYGILDVRVRLREGEQLNIEMQSIAYDYWQERSLFYLGKMYVDQIHEGEDYDKLEEISADEEKRLEYEERQKAIRDHRHMLASGRREGLREGLREGKHEHAVEMARKMLEDKLPIEKIAEYSGLSPEDVHRLEEQ